MISRLIVAAALFAGLSASAFAQSPAQGQAVRIVDERGNPVNAQNPLTGGIGASAGLGGVSAFSRIPASTASNNLTNAKASPGRAYTYQGCNTTASTIYLRIYNAASAGAVTVGTTTPWSGPYAFPANTCIQATAFAADIGIYGSAGLTYAFGTSPLDNDTTAISAGAIVGFQMGLQ